MVGTLRSYSEESREKVISKLEEIAREAAAEYGTEAKVSAFAYNPAVINPEELAQKVQNLLPDAITQYDASLAAEDFARYQKKVPGMFLWLGVGDTEALHNGKFIVPEDVLPVGVDTWREIANHKW